MSDADMTDGEALSSLAKWPKFFVLPTHLTSEAVHELEERLEGVGAQVTFDITEAQIILTAISSLRRAKFELQARQLEVNILDSSTNLTLGKRKFDSTTETVQPEEGQTLGDGEDQEHPDYNEVKDELNFNSRLPADRMAVLRSSWLTDSLKQGKIQDTRNYVVLAANVSTQKAIARANLSQSQATQSSQINLASSQPEVQYSRTSSLVNSTINSQHPTLRRNAGSNLSRPLLRETTSEHDGEIASPLPEPPDWVKEGRKYACQRSTYAHPPNEDFISLLKKIRLVRTLNMDEIGVRAYSTSIASIAAYPHRLQSAKELLSLPGCEQKIGVLFQEFHSTGQLAEANTLEADERLRTINEFYNIWGVGAKTAKDFYAKGWRHTDDIITEGWDTLARSQQIGLKYAGEFEKKIPRSEVEFIASVVTYHAKQVVDEGVVCTIVGGYRRGKSESGDVDVILSHPRQGATRFLITKLVKALEKTKWITHTLTITETNSARGEEAIPIRPDPSKSSGFDTLDKALVVWQDPGWTDREKDLAANPDAKNPNIHRRVDIIISPWRTIGCAICGWTSGTIFQRDLRRYAKNVKRWKFDSSGVRDRVTGRWIDLEGYGDKDNRAKTPLEAEKRLFQGLGLTWRPPEERCTN